MAMTSAEILLIIGAVGTAAGLISVAIISVIKAFGEFRTTVNRVDAKADLIVLTAAKIDGHVNSEKTAGEGRENTLRVERDLLREMLTDKKVTAQLLAQSAAGASTTVVHSQNGTLKPTAADATLSQIEANTAETAKNTGAV